jgi:hypothetical protein
MSLPHTLNGIIGTIVFVVFMLVLVVPSIENNQQSKNIIDQQNAMINNFNQSVNATTPTGIGGLISTAFGVGGIYNIITGLLQLMIDLIFLIVTYIVAMLAVILQVPTPFFIIFVLMSIGLIIGIVKLIMLAGD